jgi:hypothetical protein
MGAASLTIELPAGKAQKAMCIGVTGVAGGKSFSCAETLPAFTAFLPELCVNIARARILWYAIAKPLREGVRSYMFDVSMKSLREKLQTDSSLLERVARLWYVDLSSPQLLTHIEERMRDPCAARSVWEQLLPQERLCLLQVVDASVRRKGIPSERALKKAKLSPEEGCIAVTHLIDDRGLIEEGEVLPRSTTANPRPGPVRTLYAFRESGETLEHTGQELFKDYAERSARSLSRLLSQFAWDDLEKLANRCHIEVYPTRIPYASSQPADLRTRIAWALTHSSTAVELLGLLNPLAQRLYTWLCSEKKGKAHMEEVRALLGSTEEELFAVLRQLESHALAFDTFTVSAERWLFIPSDLFEVIKHEVLERTADEQSFAFFPVIPAPLINREGQPGICYDLATVIGYVHQHDVEPTKEGKLPRRMSSKIRPLLYGLPRMRDMVGDTYVDQVFQMAQGMGLLTCAAPSGEKKPRYRPGPNLPAWETRSLADQMRLLLGEWSKSTTWYDLLADGKLIYPSAYNTATVRKTLLRHLGPCFSGCWYRLDALLYMIWKEQPIPFSSPLSRYDRQPTQPPPVRTRREQWMQRGEGQLYAGMIVSALHEMGLVSLGYPSEPAANGVVPRPPEWFQLTPPGAGVLVEEAAGAAATASLRSTPEERPLIVQPSFELLLLLPDMPVLYQLIHWAEIKRIGPVSTLTLTQKALLRGMADGYSVQQVLAFLTRQGSKDLAQNVSYTIKDWSRAFKGATLAEVILVDTSSEQVALDLSHLLAENHIEARTLTPCSLAVFPAGASLLTLRRLLEKAGAFVREDPRNTARRTSYR